MCSSDLRFRDVEPEHRHLPFGGRHESEKGPLYKMQKKLVAARDLPAGHVVTDADIAIRSPNDGLPPFEYENVLGMRLTAPLKTDGNFAYDILENVAEPRQAAGGRAQ